MKYYYRGPGFCIATYSDKTGWQYINEIGRFGKLTQGGLDAIEKEVTIEEIFENPEWFPEDEGKGYFPCYYATLLQVLS